MHPGMPSWVCLLGPHAQKVPAFGTTLLCYHLESLHTFWTRVLSIPFFPRHLQLRSQSWSYLSIIISLYSPPCYSKDFITFLFITRFLYYKRNVCSVQKLEEYSNHKGKVHWKLLICPPQRKSLVFVFFRICIHGFMLSDSPLMNIFPC